MGVVIYVNGEINVKNADAGCIEDIAKIEDGWKEPAFTVRPVKGPDADTFELSMEEQLEGFDPFNDGIMIPLKKLSEYAEENGLTLNGNICVTSDWSDFDNIAVLMENNRIRTANSEIINAETDELVSELLRRGLSPEDFAVIWKEKRDINGNV